MIDRFKNSRLPGLLKKIGILLLCITAVVTATEVTHAWISRKWSTIIEEDNIVIQANNSLAFKLMQNDGSSVSSMNLAYLLNVSEFTLRPVSNLTGLSDDFFTLNKGVIPYKFEHVVTSNFTEPKQAGINYGYIEGSFVIVCSDNIDASRSKYVFLGPESVIEVYSGEDQEPATAIRISLTIGNTTTYVFTREGGTRKEEDGTAFEYKAVNNETYELQLDESTFETRYAINGCPYYINEEANDGDRRTRYVPYESGPEYDVVKQLPEAATPKQFREKYGFVMDPVLGFEGYEENDTNVYHNPDTGGRYISPDACLFKFDAEGSRQVTLRVWLEGEDPLCVEKISGKRLHLVISFNSVICSSTGEYITVGGQEIFAHRVLEQEVSGS